MYAFIKANFVSRGIIASWVILTAYAPTFTQSLCLNMSASASLYSADWRVINSGGVICSTSNYTIHSSIGEAIIDNRGSGYYAGSGYLSPGSPTPVVDNETASLPISFELFQNYPNPFNASTIIEFSLPERILVNLSIYNIAGQKVATLLSKDLNAGYKRISWDGKDQNGLDVATGIYFYRISAGEFTEIRKMLLIK